MKKLLCLFATSLLVFTSCSNDDSNSSDPTSAILVKKITEFEKGSPVSRDVVYNGNKIVSITEQDGSSNKYIYTGDFITKIENVDSKGVVNNVTEYTYTNGKMTASVEKSTGGQYWYKTKYTYNSDGTVLYDDFRVTAATGAEEEYGATGKYTLKDGNVLKLEVSYYGTDKSYVYEYDAKNNPSKNITGWALLLLDDDESAVNNMTKKTYTSASGTTVMTTYAYKYDLNNYPIERVATFPNGTSTSSETTLYAY